MSMFTVGGGAIGVLAAVTSWFIAICIATCCSSDWPCAAAPPCAITCASYCCLRCCSICASTIAWSVAASCTPSFRPSLKDCFVVCWVPVSAASCVTLRVVVVAVRAAALSAPSFTPVFSAASAPSRTPTFTAASAPSFTATVAPTLAACMAPCAAMPPPGIMLSALPAASMAIILPAALRDSSLDMPSMRIIVILQPKLLAAATPAPMPATMVDRPGGSTLATLSSTTFTTSSTRLRPDRNFFRPVRPPRDSFSSGSSAMPSIMSFTAAASRSVAGAAARSAWVGSGGGVRLVLVSLARQASMSPPLIFLSCVLFLRDASKPLSPLSSMPKMSGFASSCVAASRTSCDSVVSLRIFSSESREIVPPPASRKACLLSCTTWSVSTSCWCSWMLASVEASSWSRAILPSGASFLNSASLSSMNCAAACSCAGHFLPHLPSTMSCSAWRSMVSGRLSAYRCSSRAASLAVIACGTACWSVASDGM